MAEASHWNALLSRCGTAVGMSPGEDMETVPARVEDRVKELEREWRSAEDRILILEHQIEQQRLAALPGPYVGGFE